MPAEKLQLPVGGRMRKSGSAKNLASGQAKSPTRPKPNTIIKQPTIINTNRSQISNSTVRRKGGGKLMTLDGKLISASDNPEINVSFCI